MLVSSLPAQKERHHSFQVALWPQFHHLRMQVVSRIWQSKQHIVDDVDPLLLQKATQEYAVMLLQKKYGEGSRSSISMTEEKEKRRQTMAVEEENAIRYASGYVVEVLKKRYEKKGPITISRCLMSMEEGMAREG